MPNCGIGQGTTIISCVLDVNNKKFCNVSDFSGYTIVNSKPVPTGISWIASGGISVTSKKQITDLGYIAF